MLLADTGVNVAVPMLTAGRGFHETFLVCRRRAVFAGRCRASGTPVGTARIAVRVRKLVVKAAIED